MAQMSLNAEIMAFGYSGMLASHKPEAESATIAQRGDKVAAPVREGLLSVRSLLAQLRNPRL